jgi:hypothetical protein
MNDNELSTMVRESVADVHSATPVAEIVSRGRTVRARRRIPGVAGTLAIAAGAALAVTTLVPSGHPGVEGSRHPGNPLANARLAAWTVTKQANGDIDVTINQLQNPVGLQSTLRADGVPVRVSYSSHPLLATRVPGSYRGRPIYSFTTGVGPAYHGPLRQDGQAPQLPCKFDPISGHLFNAAVNFPGGGTSPHGGTVYLVIKPSALPAGAGLAMFVGGSIDDISMPNSVPPGTAGSVGESTISTPKDGQPRVEYSVTVSPVYASQQCTG